MKKFITLGIIFLLFTSTLLTSISGQVQPYTPSENILFSDDFESYAVGSFPSAGGWEIVWNGRGDEYQVVTDACSFSGQKSFQLWGQTGWSCVVQRKFSTNAPVIGYEFAVLFESRATEYEDHPAFFKKGAEGFVWGTYYAAVRFCHSDGKMRAEDGTILGEWSPGIWYRVRTILDRTSKTYSVWVNGELRGKDMKINREHPELIDSIALTSAWPGVKVYYDDVVVFRITVGYELKIALIFAEPADIEHEQVAPTYDRRFFEHMADEFDSYFSECSYGFVFTDCDFFDNAENWYKLEKNFREYVREIVRPQGQRESAWREEFVKDAIKVVREDIGDAFNYDLYDAVIVIGASPIELTSYAFAIGDKRIACDIRDHWFIWAHETGHALGLPDLYPNSPASEGDIGRWGLMGGGWVHFCSWSKERLGWLTYKDFSTVDKLDVYSLPNLNYKATVWRRWTDGWFDDTYFLFEVRSRDARYSRWDRNVRISPDHVGGLVVYKYYNPWIGTSQLTVTTNPKTGREYFIPGESYWLDPPFYHWLLPDRPGVRLHVIDGEGLADKYRMGISVREEWGAADGIVARLTPFPQWGLQSPIIPEVGGNGAMPDLDLHAYTYDGKHVGVNYKTGEYEIQISGAIASGDFYNSGEWIWIPENIEVYFVVSSRDVAIFLENQGMIENEYGVYSLTISYWDENMVGSGSDIVNQTIRPGGENFHAFKVIRINDTYSIEISSGFDILSLEAWRKKIAEIPNRLFINRPINRKNALVNKFEAVFKMLKENNFNEAVEKLENDILEKLNGDKKADWVKESIYVNELKAFISYIRYKSYL